MRQSSPRKQGLEKQRLLTCAMLCTERDIQTSRMMSGLPASTDLVRLGEAINAAMPAVANKPLEVRFVSALDNAIQQLGGLGESEALQRLAQLNDELEGRVDEKDRRIAELERMLAQAKAERDGSASKSAPRLGTGAKSEPASGNGVMDWSALSFANR
jgi:hypothetical protein